MKNTIFWIVGVVALFGIGLSLYQTFHKTITPTLEVQENYTDCTTNPDREDCKPPEQSCTDSADSWAKCYPNKSGKE